MSLFEPTFSMERMFSRSRSWFVVVRLGSGLGLGLGPGPGLGLGLGLEVVGLLTWFLKASAMRALAAAALRCPSRRFALRLCSPPSLSSTWLGLGLGLGLELGLELGLGLGLGLDPAYRVPLRAAPWSRANRRAPAPTPG